MPDVKTLDRILEEAVASGDIPGVSVLLATDRGVIYEGAAGVRELGKPDAMTPDTVFWIASMTKAVTAAAAMQLVERGQLDLDAPAGRWLPQLEDVNVLEGFDAAGRPRLRKARQRVTLRNLLTHTSGHGYEFLNASLAKFHELNGVPGVLSCRESGLIPLLIAEPGERWEYGTSIDWAGKMVEAASGRKLGSFLRENLLEPLGMNDTVFKLSPTLRERQARVHLRGADGRLSVFPFEVPQDPEFEMGGGGLYSTVQDYGRFCRMILQDGELEGRRVLSPSTVAEMARPQLDSTDAGRIRNLDPTLFNDVDFFPGMASNWGLSFMINSKRTAEGRSAGSLSWGGVPNSYYWIDRERRLTGVIAMQVLPYFDPAAVRLLRAVESAVSR